MTVLLVRPRVRSRPGPASGPNPGPSLPTETSAGTSRPSPACHDHPADAIRFLRLLGTEIRYIAHPSFDDPGAHDALLAPMPTPDVVQGSRRVKPPAGLMSYLASLYDEGPLLSREQEAHLFRKMNYLKCRASRLRDRIDPARVRTADLDLIDRHLEAALAIKTQIVLANLRLVVAIAKRYAGPQGDLFEWISDGNYGLVRAVDGFDYSRGNRFSTYASWAIRNQFARAVRKKSPRRARCLFGHDAEFAVAVDPRADELEQSDVEAKRREAVTRLLARLGDRERRVLTCRHGIGGGGPMTLTQLGKELGVTKERVRQIESVAKDKLRKFARAEKFDVLQA